MIPELIVFIFNMFVETMFIIKAFDKFRLFTVEDYQREGFAFQSFQGD